MINELLLAVLVEERRLERLAVVRPELEDVAHLDRGLQAERSAALRTGVTLSHFADIRKASLEVAPASTPRR